MEHDPEHLALPMDLPNLDERFGEVRLRDRGAHDIDELRGLFALRLELLEMGGDGDEVIVEANQLGLEPLQILRDLVPGRNLADLLLLELLDKLLRREELASSTT